MGQSLHRTTGYHYLNNMRDSLVCFLIFIIFCFNILCVNTQLKYSLDTRITKPECNGSVRLFADSNDIAIVITEDRDIKPRIRVTKAVLEGCGCFNLHGRKKGKGKSLFLDGKGEWVVSRKIGSVRKVPCGSRVG